MKNKNIILGIISFLFATGSAFASLSLIPPDYIHIKYHGDAAFTCSTIGPSCAGGQQTCYVIVPVNGVPQSTPVYDTKVNPTTCSVRLTHPGGLLGHITKGRIIVAADAL